MPLTPKQKHFLRGLAHHQRPSVIVGSAGLSRNVVQEIEQSLQHRELLKVKLPVLNRTARLEVANKICDLAAAELVQVIGRTCVVYRAAPEAQIELPLDN